MKYKRLVDRLHLIVKLYTAEYQSSLPNALIKEIKEYIEEQENKTKSFERRTALRHLRQYLEYDDRLYIPEDPN